MKQTPLRKIGKRGKRLAPGLKRFRQAVKERAEGLCEFCGKVGTECHHMVPRSKSQVLYVDPRNGVYLCLDCHRNYEQRDRKPLTDWFQRTREADYLFLLESKSGTPSPLTCAGVIRELGVTNG